MTLVRCYFSITSMRVVCETAPTTSSFTTEALYMDFDNQRVKSFLSYRYVEDPNITDVNRRISFVR